MASLFDTLKTKFDTIVGMNDSKTVPKGKSIATFGLGGCTGGHIDNPDTDTLFHYSPLDTHSLDETVRRNTCYAKTRKVSFFVLQEYEQDSQGEWQPLPEPVEAKEALKDSIRTLQTRQIPYEFFQYRPDPKSGKPSTATIDKEGKRFLWGQEIPGV